MSITHKLIIMVAVILTLAVFNAAWSISMLPRSDIGGGWVPARVMTLR
jgi:hypothetical protein